MKTKFLLSIVSLLIFSSAFAGTFNTAETRIPVPDQATATASGDTAPAQGSGTIHLDARIYIPDGVAIPAPVVVLIHGYGGSKDNASVIELAQDAATNGYVVVTPTMRGFGDSEGLVSLAGPNEINDVKTIISTIQNGVIGDAPAVNVPVSSLSKFGVTGASYGGGITFEIMRTHVAGLTAVVPIIGWTDLYQALAPNDVPKFSYLVGLFGSGFNPQNQNYDDRLMDQAQEFLGGSPEDTRGGDPAESIDWRSVRSNPTELSVPVFAIQGWRDWLFPPEQAISLFQASTNIPFFKLYIGGLGHAPAKPDIDSAEALFLRAQVIRWFDHWLKGIDNGIVTEPRVTIGPERTADWSEAALLNADTFPLPGATTITYQLNENTLSTTGPGGRANSIEGNRFGPAVFFPIEDALGSGGAALITAIAAANLAINSGSDVLGPGIVTESDEDANNATFTTAALSQDLHVLGIPQLSLSVSSTSSTSYYYIQLLERFPDGTSRLITRGAFKDDGKKFRKPHPISFSLFGVNHVFKSGSKIRLRIASRDFPFFLPNLDQGTVKISHGKRKPSSLILPIVP